MPLPLSSNAADRFTASSGVDVIGRTAEVVATSSLTPSQHMRCRIVRQITAEMVMLVGERVKMRGDRRRSNSHVRQIAMYVCHVALQISLTDIGTSFGRDRTTVGYSCNVVEDRRDDAAYDDFVASVERVVLAVFGAAGGRADD